MKDQWKVTAYPAGIVLSAGPERRSGAVSGGVQMQITLNYVGQSQLYAWRQHIPTFATQCAVPRRA